MIGQALALGASMTLGLVLVGNWLDEKFGHLWSFNYEETDAAR